MQLPTDRNGFLRWIARITLAGYYMAYNENTGLNEDYTEDEVDALTEVTELWLTNDKPDATDQEVVDFMFDNRRV